MKEHGKSLMQRTADYARSVARAVIGVTPPAPRPPRRQPDVVIDRFVGQNVDGRLVMVRSSPYDAASTSRIHWMPGPVTGLTPDSGDLETMRLRTRQQSRNNPIARAAVEVPVQQVLTHKIRPQSRIVADDEYLPPAVKGLRITEEIARRASVQAERAWPLFARKIDPRGTRQFEDHAEAAFRAFKRDGEILVHRVRMPLDPDRTFSTAFELIEIDRLKTPGDQWNNERISDGIETDTQGKVIRYWVLRDHPAEAWNSYSSTAFLQVPASEIKHLYREDRAGAMRAAPPGAVCLGSMRDLKDLQDATILKAQHSASHTAIAETRNPTDYKSDLEEDTEERGSYEDTLYEIQAGKLNILPIGDKLYEFASDHPTGTYDSFTKGVKGDIAIGHDLSYLSLTRDGANVNYSSMRGLYLGDRMGYLIDRAFLKRHLLDWEWESYFEEAVLLGWIEAPNFLQRRAAYLAVIFHFGSWGWVDPTKEVDAEIAAAEADIKTWDEVVQGVGNDAEEVIEQNLRLKAYKQRRSKELGIVAPKPSPSAFGKPRPPADDEEEDAEDPADQRSRLRFILSEREALRALPGILELLDKKVGLNGLMKGAN